MRVRYGVTRKYTRRKTNSQLNDRSIRSFGGGRGEGALAVALTTLLPIYFSPLIELPIVSDDNGRREVKRNTRLPSSSTINGYGGSYVFYTSSNVKALFKVL